MSQVIVTDKRNHLVDLLRFFAAAGVVLFHYNGNRHTDWYEKWCNQLWLGVPVFFVISGYCICIAAGHANRAHTFLLRRLFRIFPNYWFSILITLLIVLFSVVVYGQNSFVVLPKDYKSILATLTLLTWPFSHIRVMSWVYWTLTYELFFYLVVWLTLFLPKRVQLAALILVSVASLLLPVQPHGPLFFLDNWPLFGFGIAVYQVLNGDRNSKWLGLLMGIVNAAALMTSAKTNDFIIAGFLTAGLITISHFKPLKQNFFSRLGDYSYSIYLFHPAIGFVLLYFRNMLHAETHLYLHILLDLCSLAIVVFISKYIFTYIELPGMQYGKKLTR